MQVSFNLLASALMATGVAAASAQDVVVTIGHVAPISGAQAHFGKDNENGARMAIGDLNAKGLTIGGKRVRFELLAEDDAADPKQGTAAAQKLCDAKVNGVVGHLNSGTTLPASKIYNDCGLPHITPSSTNPEITQQGYKTTFRLLANDNALGAGLGLHAANNLNLKRIAIIDDRTAYGQGVAEVFKRTVLAHGVQVVDEQYTTDRATDFMAILTAVKSKAPDGVFYGGMDPQAGLMLRQMAQLGMTKVRFFGGDGICTDKLVELSGGAKTLANVVCAEGGASLQKMPGGAEWRKRYDAKYPKEFQVYAPYVYDAAMVLVDAMVKADSVDPQVYLDQLFKTDYQGVTARIGFDANGELKNPAMTLYEYRNGKKVPLN
ncbi:MAG: branched-chain amino acid ABC transporter substrate-binding protein [Burkholderiaceae bacterium]|nr:branched-chain amino acid ABC transporter substrate-binding protein [Burkholderiaceae bacterium]MDH3461255.1 branched-chain amino acid ABC transporter substrate-binding protein [Burkholderiaceae bacterium]